VREPIHPHDSSLPGARPGAVIPEDETSAVRITPPADSSSAASAYGRPVDAYGRREGAGAFRPECAAHLAPPVGR